METHDHPAEMYTLGIWTVKQGRDNEFINHWTAFAKWTSENFTEAGQGYLLRDERNSSRFISFGSWTNENAIQKWRGADQFQNFVVIVKELCSDFQPNTLKLVSSSG